MLAQQERPTSLLHLVTGAASTSPAASPPGPNTVKARLTPKRLRREVENDENDEYGAFIRRILRACARRVGDGDAEAFILMTGLADEIDAAIAGAVKGLRAYGYSWAEIGSRLGITRQAAQQRWGQRREPSRATRQQPAVSHGQPPYPPLRPRAGPGLIADQGRTAPPIIQATDNYRPRRDRGRYPCSAWICVGLGAL